MDPANRGMNAGNMHHRKRRGTSSQRTFMAFSASGSGSGFCLLHGEGGGGGSSSAFREDLERI